MKYQRTKADRLLEEMFCAVLNEWCCRGLKWEWDEDSPMERARRYLNGIGRFQIPNMVPATFQSQEPAAGLRSIMGKWPGDETDEEVDRALGEIS